MLQPHAFKNEPTLIAILNITPDSFSDGGVCLGLQGLLAQAERALNAGAAILELGAESTRPNATPVSAEEEIARLLPALQAVRTTFPQAVLSVDTRKTAVAKIALQKGASWINDVSGLRFDGEALLPLVASYGAGLMLMHSLGTPQTMQNNPTYPQGVVPTIKANLQQQAQQAISAGISPSQLVLDPGFGFGKTLAHNLELLHNLAAFLDLGFPILAGLSRKSFLTLGEDIPPLMREPQTALAHAMAWRQGIRWFRLHNVTLHAPTFQWFQQLETKLVKE